MYTLLLASRLAPLSLLLACAVTPQSKTPAPQQDEAPAAFEELVKADHWRKRNAARDQLAALGEDAFEVVLDGTNHASEDVRASCHEILREHFPTDARAVEAFVRGLDDPSRTFVAYPSAFHLGEHHIESATEALNNCIATTHDDPRTTYAAAKSLGELGHEQVLVQLWEGLGSDDPYTRYLSNIGVKALAGKDLGDFEYEGPWEGAFVSGPAVFRVQGQPIMKAQKRADRWQAIVRFTTWLKAERPELIAELDEKLW